MQTAYVAFVFKYLKLFLSNPERLTRVLLLNIYLKITFKSATSYLIKDGCMNSVKKLSVY